MNSLTELMSIIKSLNENITDSDTKAFLDQLTQIEHQYKNDSVVTSFVKMMRALGKYLGNRKNNAHIDSLPVLNSISEQLDHITKNPDLGKDELKQIQSAEIGKYITLKNKISSSPNITDKDMNELKEVILAIDWEISEVTTGNFLTVASTLLSKYESYKIHYTFLKIIHSVGKYIGNQKANAHTDSISFLHSVFENFEKLVQTQDMSLMDKKQCLKIDITRFQEFKEKISQKKQPEKEVSTDIQEDEILPAALSHIKQDSNTSANEEASLTTLSESEDLKEVEDDDEDLLPPALSGKGQAPEGPVDVMDDLFSLKDSPADELLDAIHLMDLNDPSQAQKMLDQTTSIESDGLKNLSPKKVENAPIPEIGSRLDEFFDLEPSSKSPVSEKETFDNSVNSIEDNQTDEIKLSDDDDDPESGIVPFDFEDESPDSIAPEKGLSEDSSIGDTPIDDTPIGERPPELNFEEQKDKASETLQRLKSSIIDSNWLNEEPLLSSINEDIAFLETTFENDVEKMHLLQTLSFAVNLLKKESDPLLIPKSEIDTKKQNKTGFWDKFKGIFRS